MKNFYAFIFTFFALALSPMIDAQVNGAGKKVKPDSIFLSGYTALSEAENLEKNKQYKDAWNKYHQAMRYYKSISINFPDWNKTLVNKRLESTAAKIAEVEPLASQEHIASQKKHTQYLKDNTSESGIPSTNLPQITGRDSQRTADLNSQVKLLQQALNEERNKNTEETAKYNQEINKLKDQLRKATQGLSTENTQTKILNDQIAKLKQELKLSQTKSNVSQQRQIEQLDRLTRERAMLATAPLKQDIERLTKDKARFEMELEGMVGVHKRLLTSHQKIKQEKDKLTEDLKLAQLALTAANQRLTNQQNAGNKILQGLRAQIKAQDSQIAQLNGQLIAANKENEQLLTQLEHANEINKELGHHLASVTLERDKLSELIDLSDADRTKKTIKEALRLGEELRNARASIKQLQANQNAAQDEIIIAENKLAVAKKKIIDLQSMNTSYIRRIGKLENSLNSTKEQLDERVASGSSNDPLQKQEVAMLKQALKRITTQLDRRKQAEALLIAEYQKADIQNAGLTNAIINLTANDVTLTERETNLLKNKTALTDSFKLSAGTVTEEQRAIAQAKSKNQIESLEAMARRFVEKGSLNTAKEIYDEAWEKHGYHYPFFINRGVVRVQLGQFLEAEEIFESGAQLKENNAYTHFMLGFCRYKNSKDELAKKSLETAVHIRPDYVDAYNYLGHIAYSSGANPQAREYLSKAVSIDPDNREAHFNLSNVHFVLGDKKKAIDSYNNALRAGLPPNFDYEKKLGLGKKVGDT